MRSDSGCKRISLTAVLYLGVRSFNLDFLDLVLTLILITGLPNNRQHN